MMVSKQERCPNGWSEVNVEFCMVLWYKGHGKSCYEPKLHHCEDGSALAVRFSNMTMI